MNANRRVFLKGALGAAGVAGMGSWRQAFADGTADAAAGRIWKGWRSGEFQIHFIYTGVAESIFLIFPDSL